MAGSFRPTLKQIFGVSLIGLTVALVLLYTVFSAGSQRTILESAERFRIAASQEAATRVDNSLNIAPRAAQEFERQIHYGITNERNIASVEAGLLQLFIANESVSEASFTHAHSSGFDSDDNLKVVPKSAIEVSVYRTRDSDVITSSRTWWEKDKYVAESHQLPLSAGTPAATPVPDPTLHLTFQVPASRNRQGQLLWTDLHWSQLDANLPENKRRVEVSVQKAILASDGEFVGVLRLGLAKDQIDRAIHLRLSGAGQDDQHLVFLCDNTGRLIAGPGMNRVVESGDDLRIATDNQPPAIVEALKQPALGNIDSDHSIATNSFLIGSERYLVTYRALAGTQGWIVGVVVPRAYYLRGLERTRQIVLGATIGLIVFTLLIGAYILRRINRAHSLLVRETLRMNRFEFSPTPDRSRIRDVNDVLEGLERAKTAVRAMGKYVPLDLVRGLYQKGKEPELGGESVELSILFTDIKDFTTVAEKMEPHRLADVLGLYLQTMTQTIQKEKGTIDKFIGDAVMAFWNAPEPVGYHALLACHAALNCMSALNHLFASPSWKGIPRFETRFGLHRDTVSVGHFGAPDRFNYTAIGDGVNLASRLEALNKQYGTSIIVSDAMYVAASDHFEFRRLDRVAVKGKSRGVDVYELVCEKAEDAQRPAHIVQYEEALTAYMDADFEGALSVFAALPADPPSVVMAKRCREFLAHPPELWDGTYALHTK
ncbi:adenylate/guanylate cyclase [Candidatus Koribacter versatilis Ellin345]|uniref:Adenylate/guanylate cyclase n=1 Tax=Koribacter versatilis (strain Ellin345) TaxID=204669 RepID=Q1IM50_KORVE|nr:adenylate/guanylate cyclase domain-containing protein [Candidatus Koribacter versatilis]ABF42050.1 adenylate/guanylate cyclase [Candidatus Koribacter versatilis Ellin345]